MEGLIFGIFQYFNLTRISQLQRRDFSIMLEIIESEGDH